MLQQQTSTVAPDSKQSLQVHPLAAMFPLMPDTDFASLTDDIRQNDLREPVVLYQGAILDGRHRERACRQTGSVCRYKDYDGTEPAHYVVSANLRRRDLTQSQKAVVAAELLPKLEVEAKERQRLSNGAGQKGREQFPDLKPGKATEHAGSVIGVNPRYVSDAKKLLKKSPEIADRVKNGKLSMSAAVKQSKGQTAPHRQRPITRPSKPMFIDGLNQALDVIYNYENLIQAPDIAERQIKRHRGAYDLEAFNEDRIALDRLAKLCVELRDELRKHTTSEDGSMRDGQGGGP